MKQKGRRIFCLVILGFFETKRFGLEKIHHIWNKQIHTKIRHNVLKKTLGVLWRNSDFSELAKIWRSWNLCHFFFFFKKKRDSATPNRQVQRDEHVGRGEAPRRPGWVGGGHTPDANGAVSRPGVYKVPIGGDGHAVDAPSVAPQHGQGLVCDAEVRQGAPSSLHTLQIVMHTSTAFCYFKNLAVFIFLKNENNVAFWEKNTQKH